MSSRNSVVSQDAEGPPAPPLRAVVKEPSGGAPKATLILLHGRGSGPEEFVSAAGPLLGRDFRAVSLQAPFHFPGGGWMWSRFSEEGANWDALRTAIEVVDKLTGAFCPAGLDGQPVYLIGFSQGAAISLAFATLRPERIRGVVAMSGFLVEDSMLPQPLSRLRGMKVMLVHGAGDASVPLQSAETAKRRLVSAGAAAELIVHPGPHSVPNEIWDWVRDWILEDLEMTVARRVPSQ